MNAKQLLGLVLCAVFHVTASAAITNSISPGQITNGSITSPGQTNFYAFTAASNDVVYPVLLLTNGPGTGPQFFLYDPDRVPIGTGYGSGTLYHRPNVRLTKTGTYTIGVIDGGLDESFDYLLSLTVLGASNLREAGDGAEAIVPGQITSGHISRADFDTFTFTAASNDVVYPVLLLTNGPGTGPQFFLYDPDRVPIGTRYDSSILSHMPNVRLTKTGTYTIGVIDGGLDEAYDYKLSLTVLGATNLREAGDGPVAILPGQITGGRISPADFDTYTFTANSNDVVYPVLLLTNGPGTGPQFFLYDPDRVPIGTAFGSSTLYHMPNVRLTKTGTYTIGVIDGGLDEAYDYKLSLTVLGATNLREAGDGPVAILPGQITGGRISPADFDTYTFTANSNDVVYPVLLLTNGPGTGPQFFLYDPDRVPIGTAFGSSTLYHMPNVRLTKTGTYTIGVIDGGLNESFDYSLCLITVPGPNFPELGEGAELLKAGETRAAQIIVGDLDAYSLSVISGDSVWITLSQTSGAGQAYMYLYDPTGNIVGAATSTTQARLRIPCATNTGYYTIAVLDSALSRSFTYNLTLLQNPGPPPSYDPAHPYLAIFRCMTNTVVRWPTNAAGFQLEYRTSTVSGGWSNVPPPYPVFANHHYVTNQSAAPMRFYRLNRPAP